MLKDNGVFFLPEYNPVIDEALQRVGFQTRIVNVPDLGGDTIVNIAGIDKDSTTILVAIKKRVAAPAPRRGGTRKVKRKARATRRRNYK
jgi:hypothetical protein